MLGDKPVMAVVPSTDLARSRAFYVDKLGLTIEESMSNDDMMFVNAGAGSMFGVYKRGEGNKGDHTQVGFKVEEIESVVKELTDKGVVFEQLDMGPIKTNEMGIAELPGVKSAWFKDPDSNIFAVNQM